MRFFIVLVPICFFALSSCAPKEIPEPKETVEYIDTPVGTVLSYDETSKIAVIHAYNKWNVPEDDVVYTIGSGGRTSNIKPSGESTGFYVAADYRSGDLQKGDAVYWRKYIELPAATIDPDLDPDSGVNDEEKEGEEEKAPESDTSNPLDKESTQKEPDTKYEVIPEVDSSVKQRVSEELPKKLPELEIKPIVEDKEPLAPEDNIGN